MFKKLCVASVIFCLSVIANATTLPNTLVIAQSIDDISSLDPAQGFELSSVQIFTNVYQRLIQPDPTYPNVLQPSLATSWTASKNSLTFTLRSDAQFASHNPIRPEDVIFSLSRVVKLKLSPAFILTQLGWNKDNVDSHLIKEGSDKVTITWDANVSSALVLSLLSSPTASIIDAKMALGHEKNNDLGHAWLSTHSAGSGPFQIMQYLPNTSLVLSANRISPMGPPKIQSVIIKNVPDAATRQLLVESGEADIAANLGIDQFQDLQGKPNITTLALPYASLYYLMFNAKADNNPLLHNPAFWQAARWAFDYKGISEGIMHGMFEPQQTFLPRGFNSALLDLPCHYDPERAKQILKMAGIKHPHFRLVVTNQPPYLDIAQALQSSFARAGIAMDIIPGISSQVSNEVNSHDYQATLSAWGPDYFDPNTNASAFAYNPEDGTNTLAWRANWHIPELTQMTLAAREENNAVKRAEMYQAIQRKVQENSPFVIGLQNKKLVAIRSNIKGYVQGIMPDMVYYQNVTK